MNITFIIGNGFDLNLGLPTDYGHFYQYYLSLKSNSTIINTLKRNIKQYKDKDWKDLELGLGQFTAEVNTVEEFQEAYFDIQSALNNYIAYIDAHFNDLMSINQKLKKAVIDGFRYPESEFPYKDKESLKMFRNSKGNSVKFNILTLNYTHTVETILGPDDKVAIEALSNQSIQYEKIFHVHREIGQNGIWLGVDNAEQIANEKFRSDDRIKILLIKPETRKAERSQTTDLCNYIINNTDLFCTFGSSIGETDQYWWKLISNRLRTENVRLIYNVHESIPLEDDNDQIKYMRENYLRKVLLKNLGLSNISFNNIENKVYVSINSSIFSDKDYSDDIEENFDTVYDNLQK